MSALARHQLNLHESDDDAGGSSGEIGVEPVDPAAAGTRRGASDDDIVTGPVPVVDLADGHVHVSLRRDVTIVSIDGGLDSALAGSVAPAVVDACHRADAVILDLDQATLLDRRAVEHLSKTLVGDREGPIENRCVVAGRMSGRLVLERWGVHERLVVFTSVADALQARTFAESGYGTGWRAQPDLIG